MKRMIVAVLFCAAFVAFSHGCAQAMIEFCPAALHVQAVGAQSADDATPAAVYGFNLTALAPRSVSATVAFDTSAGWFTIDVPQTALTEKDRHYTMRGVRFMRRDYVSPVMYVRFPQSVTLNHSWVYHSGDFTCPPPPAPGKGQNVHGHSGMQMDAADKDRLSDAPGAASVVLPAKSSPPLETAVCTEPFREATVTSPVVPDYPDYARTLGQYGTSIVQIAINADGSVAGTTVFGSSGYDLLDKAVLRAAQTSTYEPARSYCRPVPGTYLFVTTFDPNG